MAIPSEQLPEPSSTDDVANTTPPKTEATPPRVSDKAWARGCSLGIMQPYLFPYLGYFQLIEATDRWVVFDTPQFIRHGWVNRNRILHPNTGSQYILAPLAKHSRGASIQDIALADKAACQARIRGQLGHYRKRAPYYEETIELVDASFEGEDSHLSTFIVRGLALCCSRLEIEFEFRVFSQMCLDLGQVEGPGDWAPKIAGALGATAYVNPPGGEDLFDPQQFERIGVDLRILEPQFSPYTQARRPFEPGLSILDIFMWNSPQEARSLLADHILRPSSHESA